MDVLTGIDALERSHGPIVVAVGVFDGMHRGHAWLLEHLVEAARTRSARPAVITFDHHPDEVLTGRAPALLLDPEERLSLLAAAGVEVTVVQHFDEALRMTPYDAFVERIRSRVELRAFVMTPDAAFGYERRGTPTTLATLGAADGFDVVVIPPFTMDGEEVRSSAIRTAITTGDLAAAARWLGRPVTITGSIPGSLGGGADGLTEIELALPLALPPDGNYAAVVGGSARAVRIEGGTAAIVGSAEPGRISATLVHG